MVVCDQETALPKTGGNNEITIKKSIKSISE